MFFNHVYQPGIVLTSANHPLLRLIPYFEESLPVDARPRESVDTNYIFSKDGNY